MTPFELMLGVNMRTKEDLVLSELLNQEIQREFEEDRDELRNSARQNIQELQQENRRYYNLRRKPCDKYKIEDLVAIPKTQFGVGLKVRQKYYGPYEIIKVLPNDRYDVRKLIEDEEGPGKTSMSGDLLKPWPLSGRK
uniref:Putative transposon ty3-g gag-pol polyprotein n=1 Tax=Anopheles triannulatus TaxID=58253 RepID=A0A2M4AZI0_9DIPT